MILKISGYLFSFFIFSGLAQEAKPIFFKDANGHSVGEAKVTEDGPTGIKIDLNLRGLKPGTYAMHIHESGKCEGPKFESAGGHFNPTQKMHGTHNPKGFHAGDLPNITVLASGKLLQNVMVKNVSIKIGGLNSLIRPEGSSLVIHAQPDDEKSDPAGNSGDRLYCAVLTGPQVAGSK